MWPNRGASFNLCDVAACRVCRVCVGCGLHALLRTNVDMAVTPRGREGEEDRGLTKLTDNNAVHAESRI